MDTQAAEPDAVPEDEDGSDTDTGEDADADNGLDEAEDDGDAVPEPPRETADPPATPLPRPHAEQAVQAERPVEPALQILPLGGGLILVGLGLGLAFVALRVRRGLS